MSAQFRRIVAFAFGCGMISLATAALAQQAQQPTPLPKDFDVKGEFEGLSGNYMKCILNGNPMLVHFDDKSKIKVTGTATADFINKGLFVRFKGTFDRHGKGTEPIKEFVIFTPDADNSVGAVESGGSNAFDEPTPGKKKGPPPPTAMYEVAGRITAAHLNLITVDCGNMKIRAEVAPDATVKLDSSDLSWASSGDLAKVKGSVDQPPHGTAIASEVSIELSTPLAPRKKGHLAKVADKTADKSSDKTADTKDKKAGDKAAEAKKPDDKKPAATKPDDKKPADKTPDDKADPNK
jgi:hypothetical protein